MNDSHSVGAIPLSEDLVVGWLTIAGHERPN